MWIDPIVEEIHQIREAYAAKFNYDIEAICRDIKRQEQESGREFVTLPPNHSQEAVKNGVDLDTSYREMAADKEREAEALEWVEGTLGHGCIEQER